MTNQSCQSLQFGIPSSLVIAIVVVCLVAFYAMKRLQASTLGDGSRLSIDFVQSDDLFGSLPRTRDVGNGGFEKGGVAQIKS